MKEKFFYNRQSEAVILNSILKNSTEYAIIITDLDQNIQVWSKGAEILYGYTLDEVSNKKIPFALHKKEDSEKDMLFSLEKDDFKTPKEFIVDVKTKDNELIPVLINIMPRYNNKNELEGHIIISKDISNSRNKEKFRESLLDIAKIVNTSESTNIMCDEIINTLCEITGIKRIFICFFDVLHNSFYVNSQIGLTESCYSHSCYYCNNKKLVQENKRGCFDTYTSLTIKSELLTESSISKYVELDDECKDSSIIHIPLISDVSLVGILHMVVPKNKVDFFLNENQTLSLISNEITAGVRRRRLIEEIKQYADNLEKMVKVRTDQLREKDAQLIQSGKLAIVGELATGIAHEINQPLGGISLITQGLKIAKKRDKLDDNLLMNKLNDITCQVDRIDNIITHLRTFARQTENTNTEVDIRKPLLDVFKLIGQQLVNKGVDTVLDINENIPLILAEHNRLEQVFLNIIGNARDAIEDLESKISKMNKNELPNNLKNLKKKITIKSYAEDEILYIEIIDTGIGIPKGNINKIFDPFFTTKEVGRGTGLGLSITYGIVKGFNGIIEIQSEDLKGSKFIIKFPVYKENRKKPNKFVLKTIHKME